MSEKTEIPSNGKAISGLFWRMLERFGAQGIAFVVEIILAAMLTPEDYGLLAMVTVFIAISQVFVDSGMGNALIQKKDADDLDFSSVFYFNIFLCLVLYAVIFLLAPVIADFFDNDELVSIVRVLGIIVIVSSLKNIQQAYVTKKLMFKKFFFATTTGTIVAAALGIYLAYSGAGVWALVIQQLSNIVVGTLVLWFTVKWRPIKKFSLSRLKTLFSYGWKLLVSSLVDTVYTNLRQIIIGKKYSKADLGYYNRGRQFPSFIVTNINSSIDSVLLPVMSEVQNDISKVKEMTRRAIKISGFVIWPLMMGLLVVSDSLVNLLFGDKWTEAIKYLHIFCLIYAIEPIQTANLNAIKAVGRSDVFLVLEIIKKTVGICIIIITMQFGVYAIAVGMLIYAFVVSIINSWPNKKLLSYSYIDQVKDILPSVLLSFAMAIAVNPISLLEFGYLSKIILQAIIGGALYIGVAAMLKFDSLKFIISTIKDIKNRSRNDNDK